MARITTIDFFSHSGPIIMGELPCCKCLYYFCCYIILLLILTENFKRNDGKIFGKGSLVGGVCVCVVNFCSFYLSAAPATPLTQLVVYLFTPLDLSKERR